MKLETREYNVDGIYHHEDIIPPMYVVIDTYIPSSCPWDYYGMKHVQQLKYVLEKGGLHPEILITTRRSLFPHPTGPGGSVRFGDDMLPYIYKVAVKKHEDEKALQLINSFKAEIDNWLNQNHPMPDAIKHTM